MYKKCNIIYYDNLFIKVNTVMLKVIYHSKNFNIVQFSLILLCVFIPHLTLRFYVLKPNNNITTVCIVYLQVPLQLDH